MLELLHPPIVEAVLDIDCDLPSNQDLLALEGPMREALRGRYPKYDRRWIREHRIDEPQGDGAAFVNSRQAIQSLRFKDEEGHQIVQARAQGYSFNRLAPYSKLDDYLPEIKRTWDIYRDLAKPIEVRQVGLRYINRILLPLAAGTDKVELSDYLKLGPRPADEDNFSLTSFFNQYSAFEKKTNLQVNVTLTSQEPNPGEVPVILDSTVLSVSTCSVEDWAVLGQTIEALRVLKNRVFQNTLTEQCLKLFKVPR